LGNNDANVGKCAFAVTNAKMSQFDGMIGKQFLDKYGAVLNFRKREMRINQHSIPF
jgi:hypothetical protein